MTELPVADGQRAAVRQATLHGTFTVERDLAASPDAVYAAYADFAVRRRWFRMPGDPARAFHELDFRVGGHEVSRGAFAPTGGAEEALEYRSTFWDLEPGTRLRHTEQYAYFAYPGDGSQDIAHLKGSMNLQLNALAAALVTGG